ncbi:protein-methionine-sulfoxide reductase catalytic subunit MsrP [Kordiimonas sediminis]|uniref:Protein-methionine-sulfoxide reductase catalytic subunit MsrP n=1 Tax=Kordiimonas sediminis TaxID=1735581 RepID=A0A919APX5_9PROT|nr:protein-methionine-sulfoxide reductase catalytic subunit MsrP [Kordiimonas sediminis]GHF18721.1 protein-methionine-sulfoxide reductase catalytic subunit MsrP [Kordiimonas sediminis]
MWIKNRNGWNSPERDVTPESLFLNRRKFIAGAGAIAGAALVGGAFSPTEARTLKELGAKSSAFDPGEELTPYSAVTQYNNFYEFGTDKSDPYENAGSMQVDPWSVSVDGLVDRPGTYDLMDLIDFNALEERIYRLRCVEAWSMVIPWIGVPLSSVLNKIGVQSGAKYVRFETLNDRKQMPGVRWPVLDWPYVEGLRMDEAMNDLTLMAVGLYGKELPNQNGAPLRLVVPWKYGFKSIKSIVRISLTEKQPRTSWQKSAPQEYGFYSNVNPEVDHPRWSQARERRIGEFSRRKTLMFNGYGEWVADLYAGMDLAKYY